ncbi:MAG: GDP-L-fucose synthase family protein [Aequoribacter sp.]|uniref:GDP-L-fucose synthase family protein n=1 Tax=Aequoribacter sp. TaxID=2847771 RepID=UPI003C5FD762
MKNVFVAGHLGMVGSAICRALKTKTDINTIIAPRSDLDLTDQRSVKAFFAENHIDEVYLAAAKVGGIMANQNYPADFIYKNLMIQNNVINACYETGISKLLFLGSSCIYPRNAPQPLTESSLLTSELEATNEPYAIAKIAGIKLCESYNRQYGTDYRCLMPTNLYGPGDNYHPENSHVIPGLIHRFHDAKVTSKTNVTLWGTGTPRREFLHVDDLASACLHVLGLEKSIYENIVGEYNFLNVGQGEDLTIYELADIIANTVNYTGKISLDFSKPDGTPRKLLDVSKIKATNWEPKIGLVAGLASAYEDFESRVAPSMQS